MLPSLQKDLWSQEEEHFLEMLEMHVQERDVEELN